MMRSRLTPLDYHALRRHCLRLGLHLDRPALPGRRRRAGSVRGLALLIAAPFMFAIALIRRERLRLSAARPSLAGRARHHAVLHQFHAVLLRRRNGSRPACFRSCSRSPLSSMSWLARWCSARRSTGGWCSAALLGVFGVAAMFYPQLAGTELNRNVLVGLALSVAGTFSFCFGNMISLRLQRRGLPIFATTGIRDDLWRRGARAVRRLFAATPSSSSRPHTMS